MKCTTWCEYQWWVDHRLVSKRQSNWAKFRDLQIANNQHVFSFVFRFLSYCALRHFSYIVRMKEYEREKRLRERRKRLDARQSTELLAA